MIFFLFQKKFIVTIQSDSLTAEHLPTIVIQKIKQREVMFLKRLYVTVFITTSVYPAANDLNQALLQEAIEQGSISPCKIVAEIKDKYGPLFETAVQKCNDMVLMEDVAQRYLCGGPCVEILHARGVNIDAPDKEYDRTALHWAVRKRDDHSVEKVESLVKNGARVLLKDRYGKTPIEYALKEFHDSCDYGASHPILPTMLLALQKGTKVNILSPQQYTFYNKYLQLAAQYPFNNYDWSERFKSIKYNKYKEKYEILKKAEESYWGNNQKGEA